MKYIEVAYVGTWFTTLEVPDDFELSAKSLAEIAHNEEKAGGIDFQDGGAGWTVSSGAEIDEDGNLIGEEVTIED
jgi:hypothetical protein